MNLSSMDIKELTIIFGTTRGLGAALYDVASQRNSDCLVVNRKVVELKRPNDKGAIVDLSQPLTDKQLAGLFNMVDLNQYAVIKLIANASIIGPIKVVGDAQGLVIKETMLTNAVNYMVVINAFIAATKKLVASKRVLVISSGAAESPTHGLATYCASKAAIEMFVKTVAQEPHENFEIMAFRPGVMDTDMQAALRSADSKDFINAQQYRQLQKDGQLRSPSSVAQIIFKLLDAKIQWTQAIVDINEL